MYIHLPSETIKTQKQRWETKYIQYTCLLRLFRHKNKDENLSIFNIPAFWDYLDNFRHRNTDENLSIFNIPAFWDYLDTKAKMRI